jgi:hypothetical protein
MRLLDTSLVAEMNPVVASYSPVTFPLFKASTLKDQSQMGRSRLPQIGSLQLLKPECRLSWRSQPAEGSNYAPPTDNLAVERPS